MSHNKFSRAPSSSHRNTLECLIGSTYTFSSLHYIFITLFRSITMLRGIDIISGIFLNILAHSYWMWGRYRIFHGIFSIPHNIVMNMNNVMFHNVILYSKILSTFSLIIKLKLCSILSMESNGYTIVVPKHIFGYILNMSKQMKLYEGSKRFKF